MNFCRSETANLQPLARGILYFGSSAPVELMNYNCRIGSMPAPQTTRRSMIALSNEEANITKAHSADPDTVGFLLVDNCQNYHKQNDLRVGRESVMNVGMAGLYFEAADVDPAVFDLADKRKRIAQGLRKIGDEGQLPLTYILPPKMLSHPLTSNGKKETIPVELKDGMLDFVGQIGQTSTQFLKRKLPVGGDGLTYAMLLQLPDLPPVPQRSISIIRNLRATASGLAHQVDRHYPNIPDTLGARKTFGYLGVRSAPQFNFNDTDFTRLAFKTADIFLHFETLQTAKMLPDMETLLPMACKLYRAYATARRRDHALYDVGETSEWANTVPAGSVWTPAEVQWGNGKSAVNSEAPMRSSRSRKTVAVPLPPATVTKATRPPQKKRRTYTYVDDEGNGL
ncbi:hypothetical protein B0H10DRAFT_1969542 [Mycena sp. CBHHK59/15]|nr:hypothetical protein B0H10DRAFT_1969542 [Mycena sp. CBHHK59/15]